MFTLEEELMFVTGPEINFFRGAVFFARSLELVVGGDSIITNGGFGLVDTGEKKLLVTCQHVWKGFQEERGQNQDVRMCVCLDKNSPVVFDKHEPIDQDETLDIATFDITPVLPACNGRKFYPLNQNPVPRVQKGDRLILLGDQGRFRSLTNSGLEFGVTTYLVRVSSVDGLRFHADISKMVSKYVQQPVRIPKSSSHGGISGSPCFLMRENRPSQLVGFVTGDLMNYLCFTNASCLNSNGTIKRQTI
jgi:hypothetical protein